MAIGIGVHVAERHACMRRARASAARGVCRVVILNNNIIKSLIVLSDLLALQFHGVQLLRIVMTSRAPEGGPGHRRGERPGFAGMSGCAE